MESKIGSIKGMLVQRLQNMGVETCLIPGLLKQMVSVFFGEPHMTRIAINQRLAFLGWKDVELDEHTYQLAVACFEAENIDSVKSLPANWFTSCFAINECAP
jgi:hypothetical protein